MDDALKDLMEKKRDQIERTGVSISFEELQHSPGYSFVFDSPKYVSEIVHWLGGPFEFHFIDCRSDEVILLDTKEFDTPEELDKYFDEVFAKRLP